MSSTMAPPDPKPTFDQARTAGRRGFLAEAIRSLAHPGNPMHERTWSERLALIVLTQHEADEPEQQLTMAQLAERSGMSRAAITALVDRLTKLGLVRRRADETDRRRTFVTITDAGMQVTDLGVAFDAPKAH